jgi:predicted nuclease of predicted toxin-antitoxin system
VNFLVDNQLPLALARFLEAQGHQAAHVLDLGLELADDLAVWEQAAAQGMVLVSKNEDFLYLANRPEPGAALVWVRLPNCRNAVLLAVFAAALPRLIEALEAGQRVVELR